LLGEKSREKKSRLCVCCLRKEPDYSSYWRTKRASEIWQEERKEENPKKRNFTLTLTHIQKRQRHHFFRIENGRKPAVKVLDKKKAIPIL